MRRVAYCLLGLGLVGLGYGLGALHVLHPSLLAAQDDEGKPKRKKGGPDLAGVSDETKAKIKTAALALSAAMEALKLEQRYTSATRAVNTFGVLTGGLDAVKDLESGRGVDPETFSALYADLATEEVADRLTRDAEGRLLYNNKLVRMYAVTRLKGLYAQRSSVTGEDLGGPAEEGSGKKKKKSAASDAE